MQHTIFRPYLAFVIILIIVLFTYFQISQVLFNKEDHMEIMDDTTSLDQVSSAESVSSGDDLPLDSVVVEF